MPLMTQAITMIVASPLSSQCMGFKEVFRVLISMACPYISGGQTPVQPMIRLKGLGASAAASTLLTRHNDYKIYIAML